MLIDGSVALKQECPSTETYAVIGWQAKAVFAELDALRAANHLGATVVIATGTNGLVSPKELDAVLTSLADRQRVVGHHDRRDVERAPEQRLSEGGARLELPRSARIHAHRAAGDSVVRDR